MFMKQKTASIAKRLTELVSAWPSVECILSFGDSAKDSLDPYYALVLDIFIDGEIPSNEERQAAIGDPGAFESSRNRRKDRFFLDGLPIRLEYKHCDRVRQMLANGLNVDDVLKSGGPYLVHRLTESNIFFARSSWITEMREAFKDPPAELWQGLRETYQFRMEHNLSDMGGAALKNDNYFFHVSLAGFLRALASTLFALNRKWEPSDRNMERVLLGLKILPEDFAGRWAIITATDGSFSPEKIYQVAQLLVRSILSLV